MTDQEITALAREYAEETIGNILQFSPRPLPNSVEVLIRREQKQTENVIRFLLYRYALVERSKLEEEYYEAKFTCGNVDPCSETFATSLAHKSMLERLSPEISKEVKP